MFTSVLWDMGGTLLDTYAGVDTCLFDHVRKVGRIAELAEVSRLTRVSTAHAISALAERYSIPPGNLKESIDRLKDRWEHQPPKVADGAVEVLEAVRRAGGLNLIVTHRDRPSAELLLRKRQLTDLIDDMVCAPDGFARKPNPEMYRVMERRHVLNAALCLGVGDRRLDCEAAEAAGMSAALLVPEIPDGESSPCAGEPPRQIYHITNLRQLLPVIGAA